MTAIVLIDNHDSFTHLLADTIRTATSITPTIIDRDAPLPEADLYVISPGPGHPRDPLPAARAALRTHRPVVGVCLGHQLIAYEAGATVGPATTPMHGLTSIVTYKGREYEVVRYHSLDVDLPEDSNDYGLEVLARAEDGSVMALAHQHKPHFGVQFHPESIGTTGGVEILTDLILAALNPLQWAHQYKYFAWLEFDGRTRLAAGNSTVDYGQPGYGALTYEATGGIDGGDLDPTQAVFFRPEQEIILPTTLPRTTPPAPEVAHAHLAHSAQAYARAVEAAQEHITRGDSYELCLTTAAHVTLAETPHPVDPVQLYQRLRATTPAPMAGLLITPDVAIISASPERYLSATAGRISAHPIKGTRRRGASPEEDEHLKHQLATSRKDRAENLMIIDVLRNDLLRSCRPGSVTVPECAVVHTYPRVHQLVSTIEGELAVAPTTAALRAFPGGSMTGAPKQRTMDLLAELEGTPRGFYSGILGYVTAEGDMDFSMLIRTAVLRGHQLHYGAGGAVTRLSDPEEEYEEVRVKLHPLEQLLNITLPRGDAADTD